MKRTVMILAAALLAGATFAGEKPLKPGDSITDALNLAKPGDTITLSPGVYRQAVVSKAKGTPENPITLKGPAQGIAIISGAEKLTGWTPVKDYLQRVRLSSPFPAPQPDKLYMLKLDWTPKRLFAGLENGEAPATKMHIARTPNEGWWGVKKGSRGPIPASRSGPGIGRSRRGRPGTHPGHGWRRGLPADRRRRWRSEGIAAPPTRVDSRRGI